MHYAELLIPMKANLSHLGCNIENNVEIAECLVADISASRKGAVNRTYHINQHIFVIKHAARAPQEVQLIVSNVVSYVVQNQWNSIFRGLGSGYSIVCLIACENLCSSVISYVNQRPYIQKGLVALPVLCDLAWSEIHYYRGPSSSQLLLEGQAIATKGIELLVPKLRRRSIHKISKHWIY